jgi:nitroreductase
VQQTGDDLQDEEDMHAAGVAAYIVLLGAHARGLAGYWRTPGVLRTDAGRAAVELPAVERVVGLLYLGHARQAADPPGREPVEHYARFLE